jgi:transaldolase
MQIFIDTANIEEVKEAVSWGIVDGVTTNPSLIKKEMERTKAKGLEDVLVPIFKAVGHNKPISVEVVGLTYQEMVSQAAHLTKSLFGNLVIKIPVNPAKGEGDKNVFYDGLKAIKKLNEGIYVQGLSDSEHNPHLATNATLVMSPEQALLAAKAGATYVSPFAGRIDDYIRDNNKIKYDKKDYYSEEGENDRDNYLIEDNGIVSGVDLVRKTVQIFKNYNIGTKIIAASVRNARQAREFALTGVDIATIPFYVLEEMIQHKKTFEGVVQFEKDTVKEYADFFKKQ